MSNHTRIRCKSKEIELRRTPWKRHKARLRRPLYSVLAWTLHIAPEVLFSMESTFVGFAKAIGWFDATTEGNHAKDTSH